MKPDKIYLSLENGRHHPLEELDDTGDLGPFLEIECGGITFVEHPHIDVDGQRYWFRQDLCLEDCFYYDGFYYADVYFCSETHPAREISKFDICKSAYGRSKTQVELVWVGEKPSEFGISREVCSLQMSEVVLRGMKMMIDDWEGYRFIPVKLDQ